MTDKWILIVDDEEGILSVLKGSLKKLGEEYHVVTATSGQAALQAMRERRFDLVVTDYKMAGMDGLALLEQIRLTQKDIRVILMTAYGSPSVESRASHLNAYRYLAKPLEIDTFRKIVREALGITVKSSSGIPVLSDRDYRDVVHILKELWVDVGARYVFLTDNEGRYIAFVGVEDDIKLATVASLLGGSIATLIEAGKAIDHDEEASNLAYREAKNGYLYVINAGTQFQLIIVINKSSYSCRLGSVWYYALNTVTTLKGKFEQTESLQPEDLFGKNAEQTVSGELQDILLAGKSIGRD